MTYETNRRDFLKTVASAAAGVQFFGLVTQNAKAAELPSKMNLMLVITDQEQPPMWFPPTWEAQNLPTITRLKANGLTFKQAFCATAMCTPSRTSLFTGLFPAQSHSPWTLTEDYQQTQIEPQLDPALPNLATCLLEAGYDVIYKGKWHMSHGVNGVDGEWIEDDLTRYGFQGWDAPDAGGDTQIKNFGGGTADNDQRFVNDAVAFLQDRLQNPTGRPFCLIVSLVNPHDVLSYPGPVPAQGDQPQYIEGGYDDTWLENMTPHIPLPPTIDEDLVANYKPTGQEVIKLVMAGGLGVIATPDVQQKYLNFYGRLIQKVDGQIGQLLAVFDNAGATGTAALNNTLIIRTSDHGENGLSHGLRQKTFVAYDEALRVPLVWSNPILYPTAQTTDAMVSHVDFLPTICSLVGVPDWQSKGFAGIDYSSIVLNPSAPPVQDYILFTFTDLYAGSNAASFPNGPVPPPNFIRAIRTNDFKYVQYYDPAEVDPKPDQEEFYDLRPIGGDYNFAFGLPLELRNLSGWAEAIRIARNEPTIADPTQIAARTTLKNQLTTLQGTRLAARPYNPSVAPEKMNFQIVRWDDADLGPQAMVQLTCYSRINTNYQLQKSTDLVNWSNSGPVVVGNDGLILMSDTLTDAKAFYRIQWTPAS